MSGESQPPTPCALEYYSRNFTPDLEVRPREPVFAIGLVSTKGVPFVLVREAIGGDHVSSTLAWLIWRENACVGYVGTTLGTCDPFLDGEPLGSRRALNVFRRVTIWRSLIVDGTGSGTGGDVLARVPSRGLGIMSTAYVEIVRQLSTHGWALRSNPKARTADANALWSRLRATPGIEVVRSRIENGEVREFAFMLVRTLAMIPPRPRMPQP